MHLKCFVLLLLLLDLTSRVQNDPLLLFSTTKDIRFMNLTRAGIKKPTILIRNQTYIEPIDFHYEQQKIFWADHGFESILSISFNGVSAGNKTEVIMTGAPSPAGLACDWVTDKLYWTDSESNRIEVATIQGWHRKVLFWTDIDQPRAIALVPTEGLMFWTDWGESPKIERAGMNGDPGTRKIIVNDSNIFWPNGLTVDYESKLVYWLDGKLLFIKVMDYNGDNMRAVRTAEFYYPFAITQFESKLFWTDWKTMSVHYFDRKNSTKSSELYHFPSESHPMDIKVWDRSRQPKMSNHPCAHNNGGCSHLCLIAPEKRFTCACPIGIKLIDNFTCFDGPQDFLLVARRTDICLIYLDSPDYTFKMLDLKDVKYSIAVDFDPVEREIYWSDGDVKKIQKAKLNGTKQQDVISTEIQDPDGIALDWVARNIYWTDTGTDRIEVARLGYNYRRVIIFEGLVDPRGIAVAPVHGWLFWSDWSEKNPKIERSNLDGSARIEIINTGIEWPNGITLDLEKNKIYWCDAKLDKIEYSNMDGTQRVLLISDNVPHPFGFSLMGDYIFWTDWQRRAVDRARKEASEFRDVIVEQMENMMGLKAINLGKVEGWNPCKDNNGGCAQLCLYRHDETYVCACEIGYELDKKKCVKPLASFMFTKGDRIGQISIEHPNQDVTIPLTGLKNASAIDFDFDSMRIYWTDRNSHSIWRAFVNGSDPEKIIELGLATPEGIAVDSFGFNIYWTDPAARKIEVARLVGTSRRTLLCNIIDEPHSIVLDPLAGYMYWSEWGQLNKIQRAAMDGSNPMEFVSTNGRANGLTLDYEKRRLYWAEIDTPAIVSSDLDGNDKLVIVKENIYKPMSLTLFQNYIYWFDGNTSTIWRTDKNNGSNTVVFHDKLENITDLLIYQTTKPNQTNNCAGNGGCRHLCLTLPPGKINFTCACPTHYTLDKDECLAPTEFMIYSQKNQAFRLLMNMSHCPEAVLPIQGLKNVKAIDFDPKQNVLYWIESKFKSIKRGSEMSGSPPKVIVPSNSDLDPFDLAIDSIGRLLFWTCTKQNVINITRLDNDITFGSVKKIESEKPRLLAIHQTSRLLFYTNVGKVTQLIRTRLDGSHRIIITNADNINAIAVDSESNNVVWTQGQSIYISNIDGDDPHELIKEINSQNSLPVTVHLGYLYWVDRGSNELHSQDLKSGTSLNTWNLHFPSITDLISVKKVDKHPCNTPPQRCPYFCILNGSEPLCACPNGKQLSVDNRSCDAVPNCGDGRFTCATNTGIDCIPLAWRCDNQNDCTDGSDELDCLVCKANEFRCNDGHCIDAAKVCDDINDCPDTSDEKNCCRNGFQCVGTQVCVNRTLVCDGREHCADGSDEDVATCKVVTKSTGTVILVVVGVIFVTAMFAIVFYSQRKMFKSNNDVNDQSEDSLSPMHPGSQNKTNILRKGIPDIVRMSMMNDSCASTYDRRHVTGASSSSNTNGSSVGCYPRETLNPPPSPATTAASTRGSSPSSRYRPYRHYRVINQPPPPTPCSTDVCDDSDYNYPTRSRYDGGPFPPPPTPRSHCHNESCPPSPSSRSSTYFSPLPPPPSPVALQRSAGGGSGGDYDS